MTHARQVIVTAAASRPWLVRIAWFLPAIALAALSIPAFFFGLNREAAFPVSAYMVDRYPVAKSSYAAAAWYLSNSGPNDGDTLVEAAEAAADAGAPPQSVVPLLERGLAKAPASVRGWTLLSELRLAEKDPHGAGQALSLALRSGPYDYWIAARRAEAGSSLFDSLGTDDKNSVMAQTRLLWESDSMRPQIPALAETPQGARLLTSAFAGDPEKIRAINRWLAEYQRQQPLSP